MISLLFLALAAPEPPAPAKGSAYSIREVWKNHVALDGRVIRVRGVVKNCYALSCSLLEHGGRGARRLGIGTSKQFDRAIQSRLGLPVTVEGRFDARCLHAFADREFGDHGRDELVVCTDRASMLHDPKLVSNR